MKNFEFKGTKGPWYYGSNGFQFVISPFVATIETYGSFEEQNANAKLIYVSHEMLEFVQNIHSALVDKEGHDKTLSIWEVSVKSECERLITKVCDHEGKD